MFEHMKYVDQDETKIQAKRPDGSFVLLESGSGPIGDLHAMAVNGSLGEIVSYEPPAPPPLSARKAAARQKRNRLLAETDWTQLADAPADKAVWARYRQKLRDVTNQEGFPDDVRWPTPPARGAR